MKKIQICFVFVLVFFLSWQTALAKNGVPAEEWFEKGIKYEKQNVYGEAIKMYTKAIELNNQYAEAYFRRGKVYFYQHPSDCIESIKDYTKVIEIDPENGDAYYERGLLYAYKINNELAKADMETAAGLGHKKAREWLNPGMKEEEKKEETRYVNLGNYLASKGEPVVYFDFNRDDIKANYYALLDEIGMILKKTIPEVNIILAGYADETGTEEYNLDLSMRRSKAVSKYLSEKHGIPSGRIILKAYGERGPIASNESEGGRAQNRRVEMLGVKGS